jgi:hypothetical protein
MKPSARLCLYNYLISLIPRHTVKILLDYEPDGLDRLTIILGKGSDYDYRLLNEPGFKESELSKYIEQLKFSKD